MKRERVDEQWYSVYARSWTFEKHGSTMIKLDQGLDADANALVDASVRPGAA